jgi:SAM-dependent methyltransferase
VSEALEFTGERFTPECVREIWYEHWHRYAFALEFVAGKRVLDAACGEGYGSALLAGTAASVVGVDLAPAAVEHARNRYGARANLRFELGDATELALAAGAVDVVVSFETIEHLSAQRELIAGFERVLAPGGLLLISSPDRRSYSDRSGSINPHHVKELYREEFEALLRERFGAVRLFGQKLLFQSAIWSLDAAPQRATAATVAEPGAAPVAGLDYEPLYYVALCARAEHELPADLARRVSLFGDRAESVYAHYNAEVGKHIRAGTLLAEAERRAAEALARAERAEQELARRSAPTAPDRFGRLRRLFGR